VTRDIRTARLWLRRAEARDAGWIATEIARPEVQRMLTSPPHPYRLQDAEDWLAGPGRAAGVFIVESDRPLGVVTLTPDRNGGELGYWLRRDAWGQGVMTEAAGAVLDWHFSGSSDPVPSGHVADNTGSRKVLVKLGFHDTHRIRRHSSFRGADVPVQRMELTAAAWARRAAGEA